MVDPRTSRRWLFRALFAGLVAVVLFASLLPIDPRPARVPGPDLPLVLAYAWVLRRPDYVPVLLVAALMLLGDILLMRPPGLWTACAVLGLEALRAREPLMRDLPLLVEWAMVAVVLAAVTGGYWLVMALFVVERPAAGLIAMQFLATLAVYPLVVGVSRWVFGVRRRSPRELATIGLRS